MDDEEIDNLISAKIAAANRISTLLQERGLGRSLVMQSEDSIVASVDTDLEIANNKHQGIQPEDLVLTIRENDKIGRIQNILRSVGYKTKDGRDYRGNKTLIVTVDQKTELAATDVTAILEDIFKGGQAGGVDKIDSPDKGRPK
jgi:hypothetical protein